MGYNEKTLQRRENPEIRKKLNQRKKMKTALFCLVLALIVAIEAAPVEEAEAEMKIETRADAEAFLRRYLNIEERKIDPCADCCRGKADLGRAVCCASFGTLC